MILIYLSSVVKTWSTSYSWSRTIALPCWVSIQTCSHSWPPQCTHHHSAGHSHCWEGINGLESSHVHHFSSFCSPLCFYTLCWLKASAFPAPIHESLAIPGSCYRSWLTGQDRWYSKVIAHLLQLPGGKTLLFVPSSAFSAAAMITPYPSQRSWGTWLLPVPVEPPLEGSLTAADPLSWAWPWEETQVPNELPI